MNYEIKRNKDNVVIIDEENMEYKLDFEFIKRFSKRTLLISNEGNYEKPSFKCDPDLILYKETLEEIYESIVTDNDLKELYKKHIESKKVKMSDTKEVKETVKKQEELPSKDNPKDDTPF